MTVQSKLVSTAVLVATIFASGSSVVAQDSEDVFPALAAASSANGAFLVIWEYEYTHSKADPKADVAPLKKVTYHVSR